MKLQHPFEGNVFPHLLTATLWSQGKSKTTQTAVHFMSCNKTLEQLQPHLYFHTGEKTLQSSREHTSPILVKTQVKQWNIYKDYASLPHAGRATESSQESCPPSTFFTAHHLLFSLESNNVIILPKLSQNPYCSNLIICFHYLTYTSILISLVLGRKKTFWNQTVPPVQTWRRPQ